MFRFARLALLVVLGHVPMAAQNTPTAGGSGGSSYLLACEPDDVLVGLWAYGGGWIDRVRGICSTPNLGDGRWWSAEVVPTKATAGVLPLLFTPWTLLCPDGYAVKGFRGTAGIYVNSIVLNCAKLGPAARTGSETKSTSMAGATGGTAYGPYVCGEEKPAIGLRGKSGQYIDSMGLVCGYLMPAAPALTVPVSGAEVPGRRPTFDWESAARARTYTVCLSFAPVGPCAVSASSGSSTSWTSATDLPLPPGAVVYWKVSGCNANGCTASATRSYRSLP
jgi:hypothetical protein